MIKIHPSAEVKTSKIGENTVVWQFVVILGKAIIGNDCNINCHVFIENDVKIGDNVTIKSGVQLWDGIRVCNDVFIGPNVTFTNDLIPRSKQYPKVFTKSYIREGASIGANSTIIAGNEIGAYSMIGAGSVITRDVPPFTLWYGNPAKHTGYITKNGIIINLELYDKNGNQYYLENYEPKMK